MDKMHKQTDRQLKRLERRLQTEYKKAYKDLSEKLNAYLRTFEEQDRQKLVLLNSGIITKEEYITWRQQKIMGGKRWQAMRDSIAKKMTQTNLESMGIINNTIVGVFADNANYGAFEIEAGFKLSTDFTLYNENTARLLADKEHLYKHININKDYRWNSNKIGSAMLQSVLQGESIPAMAKRLQTVTDMNYNSAVRNARTMITGAENAGRLQGYRDMDERGLHAKKVWEATLSGRTRESHRLLDNEVADIEEPFRNGLMYPGDPDGEPGEVYNCRCTMIAQTDNLEPWAEKRWSELPEGLSYEEWKEGKN